MKIEKTDDFQSVPSEENLTYETKEMRYRAKLSIQVCPQENCNFSTKFSRFLKYHMDTKHPVLGEEKKFVCDVCEAGFAHSTSLKIHKKRIHNVDKIRKKCPCPYCDYQVKHSRLWSFRKVVSMEFVFSIPVHCTHWVNCMTNA